MLENLISFAISILIGLLLGIERERSYVKGAQAIGVRTFMLLALLGTIVSKIDQAIIIAVVSVFVFSLILLGYFRSTLRFKKNIDAGITTEISAGIVFCLGFMVPYYPLASIAISAVVLLILIERKRLHKFSRRELKPHEIESAVILLVFVLGVLPVLPNHPIDPWHLFNPRNFGLLMATIAGIQFAGYLAIRLFDQRVGMMLTGFLGGLVSSTAVFATLPSTLRSHPHLTGATIGSALLAIVAMLVEVAIILLVASPVLLGVIFLPIVTMMMVGIISAWLLFRHQQINPALPSHLSNPLDFFSVFRTSVFIGIILIVVAIAKRYLGAEGVMFASFISGLFEIHGVTLATALLYVGNQLKLANAGMVLALAIMATFVSKIFLLWSLTPYHFALRMTLFLLGILLSGGLVYWLMLAASTRFF